MGKVAIKHYGLELKVNMFTRLKSGAGHYYLPNFILNDTVLTATCFGSIPLCTKSVPIYVLQKHKNFS